MIFRQNLVIYKRLQSDFHRDWFLKKQGRFIVSAQVKIAAYVI